MTTTAAPAALTFDSLCSDILVYAERSDPEFTAQVPRFVMLAEQRLALEAKGLGFVRAATGTFPINNPVFEKPDRWRQTKSIFYKHGTDITYLLPRKYEYCRTYAAGQPAGLPEYYADYDYDHYFLAVAPDAAYEFELMYYERPTPLSATVQTNWTTRYAPQLLLYACLLEAQPFIKSPGLLSMWQSQYAQVIASLQKEETEYGHDTTEAGK